MNSLDVINHQMTDMAINKASLVQQVLNEALEAAGMDFSRSENHDDTEEQRPEDPAPNGHQEELATGEGTLKVRHVCCGLHTNIFTS